MFVGAINQDLRAIIAGLSSAWRDRPVYVGCSGAFTIERILHSLSVKELHGNDVSLFSSAIGAHLSGNPFRLVLRDERLAFLAPYLSPGLPAISTLLLCTTMLDFFDRDHPYHHRMWNAHVRRFPNLHADTLAKITKAVEGVRLQSYFCGDVVEFMDKVPSDAVALSFPPTYSAGYERLYRKLQAAFDWDEPSYELFNEARFSTLIERMTAREHWVISRDAEIPSLAAHQVASVQTGMRSKPVFVYANQSSSTLTLPRQRTDPVPYDRLTAFPSLPISIVKLSGAQLNTLRSEYLNPDITPGAAHACFGLLADRKLFGAFAVSRPQLGGGWRDVYLLSDFPVQAPVPRLSKLVLAAILSKEVQSILEQTYACRVRLVGTTAFTKKPVSMKYRSILRLHSRKEGSLNYVGEAGRWSLADGFAWWAKNHGSAKIEEANSV